MSSTRPVALIIGMGPGLSAALAQRFAAGGYTIAGFARSPEKSGALAAAMADEGHKLDLRAVDAGDFTALASAVSAVEAQLGPIEVLIYNAYSATSAPPSQIPLDALITDFRVNVGGALAAVQAVLPAMQARGKGSVLLTGGGLALDPTPWLPAASLAVGKAGIRSLARSLHKEMEGSPIRVGTVTVTGQILPGTPLAPEIIAERFWDMHTLPAPVPAEVVL
ncbi:glucose 1-dehydrogenase [Novosphingobium sediminis]|uniref:Glucose 1-dehydrogenase n=1 Tax=Novosphingobium sediminis TaxID=707214 RepID=A0A512ALC9_9SPHN|nr:SDR family NAD(P)-dependent oxidoreductase [Novosphingobium sediminis]GEO00486.1 glucose 1-dehydrogenase [Novosphingobium sediminis]